MNIKEMGRNKRARLSRGERKHLENRVEKPTKMSCTVERDVERVFSGVGYTQSQIMLRANELSSKRCPSDLINKNHAREQCGWDETANPYYCSLRNGCSRGMRRQKNLENSLLVTEV